MLSAINHYYSLHVQPEVSYPNLSTFIPKDIPPTYAEMQEWNKSVTT